MQDASPTVWIEQLAEGDDQAAQRLREAYYRRLVGLARIRKKWERRLDDAG